MEANLAICIILLYTIGNVKSTLQYGQMIPKLDDIRVTGYSRAPLNFGYLAPSHM